MQWAFFDFFVAFIHSFIRDSFIQDGIDIFHLEEARSRMNADIKQNMYPGTNKK
jgi:hypothetical protein